MNMNLLISQDLSCAGQVSMSVALPILGACGYSPSILPTAMLSTHTGGFGRNTFLDLSDEISKIIDHLQEVPLDFDTIYLGYLGANALNAWLKNIKKIYQENQIILLDPVMGDHGKFYSGMNSDYAKNMQKLAKYATILTPNLTEACMLLDIPLNQISESLPFAQEVMENLKEKMSNKKIVITGIPLNDEIGMIGYDGENTWTLSQKKIGRSFFGTGDIFASVFLASYLTKADLKNAAEVAAKFITIAIKNTKPDQDQRFGPNYAAALPWLIERLRKDSE
ncbi:pyridoxamine kinase [Lactobacillus kalixensis]|nr:pyridoxamine kinase [Lactobacillus kalixensis]